MRRIGRCENASVLILILSLGCALVSPVARGSSSADNGVEILSPKQGQHLGGEGDKLCPSAADPCYKIRVEGRVPESRFAFLAVEPQQAAPRMWIQPLIHSRRDGSFSSMVNLGEPDNGAGKYFKLYLFACENKAHFHDGQQILDLPNDCLVSEPVEVLRER